MLRTHDDDIGQANLALSQVNFFCRGTLIICVSSAAGCRVFQCSGNNG